MGQYLAFVSCSVYGREIVVTVTSTKLVVDQSGRVLQKCTRLGQKLAFLDEVCLCWRYGCLVCIIQLDPVMTISMEFVLRGERQITIFVLRFWTVNRDRSSQVFDQMPSYDPNIAFAKVINVAEPALTVPAAVAR